MRSICHLWSAVISAYFLIGLSLSAAAENPDLFLCSSYEYESEDGVYIVAIPVQLKVWLWRFNPHQVDKLITPVPDDKLFHLKSFLSDQGVTDIHSCWQINAATAETNHPLLMEIATSSMVPIADAASAGNRLALRKGYLMGLAMLVIVNNFYPQYLYVGWASLALCFLFPDYADTLIDKALSFVHSTDEPKPVNWGSGHRLGSSAGQEQTTNVGYSSATVAGGDSPSNPALRRTGNVHHF